MNYITTTQLRTQVPKLIQALKSGKSVNVIHRSEVIGEFKPKKVTQPKIFDAKRFGELVEKMNLPKLTPKQRERNYRRAMEKKHGKYLPRH